MAIGTAVRNGTSTRAHVRSGEDRSRRARRAALISPLALLLVAGSVQAQTRDLLLPPGIDTAWHGVWLPFSRTITSSQITTFEGQANKKIGSLLLYVGWYNGAWDTVQRQLDVIDPMGINVMVTWEPFLAGGGDPLAAILSGSQDAIIDDFANKSKTAKPFFLRFAHEMNGNWYPWSGDSQRYIAAWQYVWQRFQDAGNTKAVWVWSPNADSVPNESWNDLHNYYPGHDFVDWVGVDFYGLKWGDQPPGPAIDKVYWDYGAIKPIMVGETAAADCANHAPGVTMNKEQWITSLFTEMDSLLRPNVRAFFWFNESKEADWRVTSCNAPAAQTAYRAGVASSKYVTRATAADAEPPTAPSTLVVTGQTMFSISLAWAPATDNVAVVSYQVYVSGSAAPVASVSTTSATITGLVPGTTYTFSVKAVDGAGNVSPSSPAVSATTAADTEAPSTPAGLVSTGQTSSSVSLSWSPSSDNVGVAAYDVYMGAATVPSSTTTSTSATVAGLIPATTYSFTVKARDASGNASAASAAVSATTPAVAVPTVNLARNRPATASSGSASLAVDGNMGTRWASAAKDPQWIRVDLGSVQTIGRVTLRWEAAYGRTYRIQTSNNGTTWTDVYSTTTGDGGVDDIVVSASARYVRMYGTKRGTVFGYSIWELEVYGPGGSNPPPPPPPSLPNLVSNPEFDSGTTSWTFWNDASVGASATSSVVAGAGLSGANTLRTTIANGGADWQVQVVQGLPVTAGRTYRISFMAKADAARTVRVVLQQNGGAWTEYFSQTVSLTTAAAGFGAFTFTPTVSDATTQLKFYLGGNTTAVYLDKVVVTEE